MIYSRERLNTIYDITLSEIAETNNRKVEGKGWSLVLQPDIKDGVYISAVRLEVYYTFAGESLVRLREKVIF